MSDNSIKLIELDHVSRNKVIEVTKWSRILMSLFIIMKQSLSNFSFFTFSHANKISHIETKTFPLIVKPQL